MKTTKIIYWTSTVLIFLFEGLMPALFSQSEEAKQGIAHLGYPAYFGIALTIFKVAGSICLILPMIPARIKEWAYACFAVEFLFASISHTAVDGFGGQSIFPLIVLIVLILSYRSYHKLHTADNNKLVNA